MDELKPITKNDLLAQQAKCHEEITRLANEIAQRQRAVDENRGTLKYVEWVLKNYEIPEPLDAEVVNEPPTDK